MKKLLAIIVTVLCMAMLFLPDVPGQQKMPNRTTLQATKRKQQTNS